MTAPCSVPDCQREVGAAPAAMVVACPGEVTAAPSVFCLDCARRVLVVGAFSVPRVGYRPLGRHGRMY